MVRMKYLRINMGEWKKESKMNQARAASKRAASQQGESNPLSELSHLAGLLDFYMTIEDDYVPEPADLEMVLIRGELFRAKFDFPEGYGWSGFAKSVRTINIPGFHAVLFNKRFIAELRDAFVDSLKD